MSPAVRDEKEDEGGEFAEFMADVSREIAQRVEAIAPRESVPTPARTEARKTPGGVDAGVIVEWEELADRMIEEMR